MGTDKRELCPCGEETREGQRNCQKCHAEKMREYRERMALERRLMKPLLLAASNYRRGVLDVRYALAAGGLDRLRKELFEATEAVETLS